MKVHSDPLEIQVQARKWRQNSKTTVGFVPTMGSLHEGHLELVRISNKQNSHTVVSIYVNPLQFGPQEDLAKYPRALEKDLELLKKEKVSLVFTPSDKEMYPAGFSTQIVVSGPIVQGLCAPHRPGHFNGVATVVVKLLNSVQPNKLYLGQKDAQQAVMLKKVIQDLDMDVETVICPIIREHDGLAMSSRNQRLSLEGRKVAPVLHHALKVGKSIVDLGETNASKVLDEVKKVIEDERKIKLQYLEAVDSESLEPVSKIKPGTMLALAAHLENVRLIDNIVL
ncbi:MAG TPA: pantoate--beta-alanine ligase [bacterium]